MVTVISQLLIYKLAPLRVFEDGALPTDFATRSAGSDRLGPGAALRQAIDLKRPSADDLRRILVDVLNLTWLRGKGSDTETGKADSQHFPRHR